MTTPKQGDLIKDKHGINYKVLGICGEVVHISHSDNHNSFRTTITKSQLKEYGYTWDTPAWEPKVGMQYYFLDSTGSIGTCGWDNDNLDQSRRDLLGIYQSEELAKAALLEIRRKLQ